MANKFWGVLSENLLAPVMEIKKDIMHILDLFSDGLLALMMYKLSRDDWEAKSNTFKSHYHICCVWISLSIFSPILILYSTLNNRLYNQGMFEKSKMA